MRYARGGRCRGGVLLEHFGEEPPFERCGHCDHCERLAAHEAGAAARGAAGEGAATPPAAAGEDARGRRFAAGDAVRVPRHGEGTVRASDASTVTIEFPKGRRRSFLAEYVERVDAGAAEAGAHVPGAGTRAAG